MIDEKKPRETPRPLPPPEGGSKDTLPVSSCSLASAKTTGRTSIACRLCPPNQTDNQATPAGQFGTFLTKPKL